MDGQYGYLAALSSCRPGSAEFLRLKLTVTDEATGLKQCRHAKTDSSQSRPRRLGFFYQSDLDNRRLTRLSWVDPDVLCVDCYESALPRGFSVWSTTYDCIRQVAGFERQPYPSLPDLSFPPMFRAGHEDDQSQLINNIPFPNTEEAHLLWNQLIEDGQPFYIDLLHLDPPYDPNANREAEMHRILHYNFLAYSNAARGYSGSWGDGGLYCLLEQRILRNRGSFQDTTAKWSFRWVALGPEEQLPNRGTADLGLPVALVRKSSYTSK